MGRGGGRGRGGRGRGRGGSRGRNKGPKKADGGRFSAKEVTHLKEFGETHPSEELQDFGPSPKRGRHDFSNGRGRGRGRGGNNHYRENREEESSESESEEETPYGELLTLLSGRKQNQVEIQSESEEEEEEEEEEVQEKVHEVDEIDEENSSESEVEGDHATNEEEVKGTEVEEASEEEEEEVELPEETVIVDEELDPDAVEDAGKEDPFLLHFERQLPAEVQESIKVRKKLYTVHSTMEFPVLERVQFSGMEGTEGEIKHVDSEPAVLESKKRIGGIPGPPVFDKKALLIENLPLKSQLLSRIGIANQAVLDQESCPGPLTPFQLELLYFASQYRDIYFPQRNRDNQEAIRVAYCVHAVNHVMKTRVRILHHNAKMANRVEVPEEFQDQSFVRPKVLILVPFKDCALRIVKVLITLFLESEKGNVANKKRFVEQFSGETLFMPKTNPKPDDYMDTFSGNIDDNFRMGISVTKKSMKLFTDFYSSDIIIASPLGLRVIIGAEGESQRDYDFLSSIELCILDQADVFLMQNWDHTIHLINHLHLQPKTTHGTDFSRIRPWALEGLTKFYCQTLVFSSINCPELIALFTRHCKNYAGLVKVVNPIAKGSICQVTVQLPQVYQRFDCPSLQEMNECRFDYFVKKVLPSFTGKLMSQTLIFVSSYFDFVRLRNHFKREETSFVQICEYTKEKKIARARDLFFHNENHFLLHTERAMFFRRFRLKGVGHIIFYQLPQNPHFYSELCNFVQEGFQNRRVRQRKNSSVTAIYCQYDAARLAAVVGSERASVMLSSDKQIHAFVTGEI